MAAKTSEALAQATDILGAWRSAKQSEVESVSIAIHVDTEVSRSLALAVRDALLPESRSATVSVRDVEKGLDEGTLPDVAVVLSGASNPAVTLVAVSYARQGVPVAVLATSLDDLKGMRLGTTESDLVTTITTTDAAQALEDLAGWLVQSTQKGTAFAAAFPFCRDAQVHELMQATASRSASTDGKPDDGEDADPMEGSQVKLVLDVAAAHGRPFGLERIPDLIGAIGADIGIGVAESSPLGQLPVIGQLVSAGVGAIGTMATGNAVTARIDHLEAEEARSARQGGRGRLFGRLFSTAFKSARKTAADKDAASEAGAS